MSAVASGRGADGDGLPPLSREQLRQIDQRALSELGVPGLLLMENAGRGAAESLARRFGNPAGGVAIVCGSGNNGGDGLVVARQLACRGVEVELFHTRAPEALRGDAALQREIVDRLGTRARSLDALALADADLEALSRAGLIVDALLGTGFQGELRAELATLIEHIEHARRASGAPLVALDLPSGLDADSGRPAAACVRADLTLSFCSTKLGFFAPGAAEWTGELEVVGLGLPLAALRRLLVAPGGLD